MRYLALPFHIAVEERVHDDRAASIGEKLATQADQATAGHAELDTYSSVAVIVHIGDFALARAKLLHHDADEFLRDIDGEMFDGFHELAIDALSDDLGFADHELVTFTAHHLDENGKLQFSAS